jgi:hypothetical protein
MAGKEVARNGFGESDGIGSRKGGAATTFAVLCNSQGPIPRCSILYQRIGVIPGFCFDTTAYEAFK